MKTTKFVSRRKLPKFTFDISAETTQNTLQPFQTSPQLDAKYRLYEISNQPDEQDFADPLGLPPKFAIPRKLHNYSPRSGYDSANSNALHRTAKSFITRNLQAVGIRSATQKKINVINYSAPSAREFLDLRSKSQRSNLIKASALNQDAQLSPIKFTNFIIISSNQDDGQPLLPLTGKKKKTLSLLAKNPAKQIDYKQKYKTLNLHDQHLQNSNRDAVSSFKSLNKTLNTRIGHMKHARVRQSSKNRQSTEIKETYHSYKEPKTAQGVLQTFFMTEASVKDSKLFHRLKQVLMQRNRTHTHGTHPINNPIRTTTNTNPKKFFKS